MRLEEFRVVKKKKHQEALGACWAMHPWALEIVKIGRTPQASIPKASAAFTPAQVWQFLLNLLGGLARFETVNHLVEFRTHLLADFAAHLAHHAAECARIFVQPGQVAWISQVFKAVFLRAADANPSNPALDIFTMAVRALDRFLAVFVVLQK